MPSYIEINDEKSNPNERIEITRPISKRKVVFEVRNDVFNFKPETWKRLVAVFIEGVKNEFREWPDGAKPAILFAKSFDFISKENYFIFLISERILYEISRCAII